MEKELMTVMVCIWKSSDSYQSLTVSLFYFLMQTITTLTAKFYAYEAVTL